MIELDSLECDFSDADDILGESHDAPLGPLGLRCSDFNDPRATYLHPSYGTFLSSWQKIPLTLQNSACFDLGTVKSGGNA
jgi:hypothetical protein